MCVADILTIAPCCDSRLKITLQYIFQLHSDKSTCCFLNIVIFDSVQKISHVIKFSFEVVSLANSSMRQVDLSLPILCNVFHLLREIGTDTFHAQSQINCLYIQFSCKWGVYVCVFLLIPKSHCVMRKLQGRVARAPDQACGWVAWIHKSGSSVNLSQVLESQSSVNMLPQDTMGFKGFLSPKRN